MTTDTQPTPRTLAPDDAASTDARNAAEPTQHRHAQPDTLPEMERLTGRAPKVSSRTGFTPRFEGDVIPAPGSSPSAEPPQPRLRTVEEPGSTTRLPTFFAQPREGEDQAKGADDSATESQSGL